MNNKSIKSSIKEQVKSHLKWQSITIVMAIFAFVMLVIIPQTDFGKQQAIESKQFEQKLLDAWKLVDNDSVTCDVLQDLREESIRGIAPMNNYQLNEYVRQLYNAKNCGHWGFLE